MSVSLRIVVVSLAAVLASLSTAACSRGQAEARKAEPPAIALGAENMAAVEVVAQESGPSVSGARRARREADAARRGGLSTAPHKFVTTSPAPVGDLVTNLRIAVLSAPRQRLRAGPCG